VAVGLRRAVRGALARRAAGRLRAVVGAQGRTGAPFAPPTLPTLAPTRRPTCQVLGRPEAGLNNAPTVDASTPPPRARLSALPHARWQYSGEWRRGLFHGRGELLPRGGGGYWGGFERGRFDGVGVLVLCPARAAEPHAGYGTPASAGQLGDGRWGARAASLEAECRWEGRRHH
jgi:hypothetical protein